MGKKPSTALPVKEHSERDLADQILRDRMEQIGHKLLVLSGKGGVGKSTVATNRRHQHINVAHIFYLVMSGHVVKIPQVTKNYIIHIDHKHIIS